jgi:hypothetical protein
MASAIGQVNVVFALDLDLAFALCVILIVAAPIALDLNPGQALSRKARTVEQAHDHAQGKG